ncbi:MAG TPA: ATP-binding cassette domain-containing protein [Microlunatus sp.]
MIVVTGLTKRYGSRLAVDDLSFEIRPGVVTGFLGPNGAGKSSAMRLMLDLDHGDGQTRFDGRRFREIDRPMREIGTMIEGLPFHPTRRARDHLRMLAAAGSLPNRRVDEVLGLVGLSEVARKRPVGFSLGMAQRLGLAAALLGDPHTLILDEPANGLDPEGIQWLRDLLKTLGAEGRTVFVSSHLLSEMELMADELIVIGRGRLLASGTVASFVGDFTRTSTLVHSPQIDALVQAVVSSVPDVEVTRNPDRSALLTGVDSAHVGEIAAAGGFVLHQLATRTASLEEAFFEATRATIEYRGQPLTNDLPMGGRR